MMWNALFQVQSSVLVSVNFESFGTNRCVLSICNTMTINTKFSETSTTLPWITAQIKKKISFL